MGKQKIITTYVPAPKAVDFDQFTNKWSAEGWIVKQISTSSVDVKDGQLMHHQHFRQLKMKINHS